MELNILALSLVVFSYTLSYNIMLQDVLLVRPQQEEGKKEKQELQSFWGLSFFLTPRV